MINFLNKGAQINAVDHRNALTPLRSADKKGFKDIVEVLLDRGANVEVKNRYGGTLLQSAAVRGDKALVKLLLNHHAELSNRELSWPNSSSLCCCQWECRNGRITSRSWRPNRYPR